MKSFFTSALSAFIVALLLTSAAVMLPAISWSNDSIGYRLAPVVAGEDDDDDEDEDEDEDDDDDRKSSSSSSSKVETRQVVQEVIEYKPVTRIIKVTPEAYKKDSDGDGLVDAVDPSPWIKQMEYFTDTDGDGVPNAIDKHHDVDDWLFFEGTNPDPDGNGEFEPL